MVISPLDSGLIPWPDSLSIRCLYSTCSFWFVVYFVCWHSKSEKEREAIVKKKIRNWPERTTRFVKSLRAPQKCRGKLFWGHNGLPSGSIRHMFSTCTEKVSRKSCLKIQHAVILNDSRQIVEAGRPFWPPIGHANGCVPEDTWNWWTYHTNLTFIISAMVPYHSALAPFIVVAASIIFQLFKCFMSVSRSQWDVLSWHHPLQKGTVKISFSKMICWLVLDNAGLARPCIALTPTFVLTDTNICTKKPKSKSRKTLY